MKSRSLSTVGFIVSNRDRVCWIFGIDQPSNPSIAALSLMKSRVSRHFPGDCETGYTWPVGRSWFLNDVKLQQSIYKSCVIIAVCFSAEWSLCRSLLGGSCGSAGSELKIWCAIVVNNGLTTTVKGEQIECTVCTVVKEVWVRCELGEVTGSTYCSVTKPRSFWRSVRQSKHVCTECEGGWVSPGWHAKDGPRRYVRFHSKKT
jgi:hypothetical protein